MRVGLSSSRLDANVGCGLVGGGERGWDGWADRGGVTRG